MVSPISAAGAYAKLARLADPAATMPKVGAGGAIGGESAGPSFGSLVKDAIGSVIGFRANGAICMSNLSVRRPVSLHATTHTKICRSSTETPTSGTISCRGMARTTSGFSIGMPGASVLHQTTSHT